MSISIKRYSFLIWLLTSIVGAIGMSLLSLYKWGEIKYMFPVAGIYLIIGLVFSFHSFIVLPPILRYVKRGVIKRGIPILILASIILTLISFLPFFSWYYFGSIQDKIRLENFFQEVFPVYAFSSVLIIALIGIKVLKG